MVVSKAIDYGWTAYDSWQAQRVLRDPNASMDAKKDAGLTIALAVGLELAEPDDFLPIGLPTDDLAPRAASKVFLSSDEAAKGSRNLPFKAVMEASIADVSTDEELFDIIATAMKFPAYFGSNWDALEECLRDMDWVFLVAQRSNMDLVTLAATLGGYVLVLSVASWVWWGKYWPRG